MTQTLPYALPTTDDPGHRRRSFRLVVALVIAQGLCMFGAIAATPQTYKPLTMGDVQRFAEITRDTLSGKMPYRDFVLEYPPGALVSILPPAAVIQRPVHTWQYLWVFLLHNVFVAGVITVLLARWHGLRAAAVFNLLLAIGALYVPMRFDLLPALITLLAVQWTARRPGWAGVSLAAGVIVKLYPAVLLPVLLLVHLTQRRWRSAGVLAGAFTVALLVVLAPIMVITDNHVFDFLQFHSVRGVQIESIIGGIIMIAGKLGLTAVAVRTDHFSIGVNSPWSLPMIRALNPLMLVAFAVQWTLLWRRWKASPATIQDIAIAAATTLGIFICFNRVFSPQYLVWLMPLVVIASRRWALLTIICLMTSLLFPIRYRALMGQKSNAIFLLNARNALVLILVIYGVANRSKNVNAPELAANS